MANYFVDVNSIKENFPPHTNCPALLLELAQLVGEARHGSLGSFDGLAGELFDENQVDDVDALPLIRAKTALFLPLPDGSRLALWWHADNMPPAVVLIESEGEHKTLAPTLEAFLVGWSKGKSGVSDLDDTAAGAARPELAAWLSNKTLEAQEPSGKTKAPSFAVWLKATVKQAQAARKKGPKSGRVKPVLGAPTAASVKDLVERALPLLEHLITEPEVIAFFAELGVDILGISKPDVLRGLVIPELGFEFGIEWPWAYAMIPRLCEAYPKAKRSELEASKARLVHSFEVTAAGYKSWNNGRGGYVVSAAFPGTLPSGLDWKDNRNAVLKKLGAPTDEDDDALVYKTTTRSQAVIFADGDSGVPKGGIERICWSVI